MKTGRFYIETRVDGFPWTREGCNPYFNDKYWPFESTTLAEAHIALLKTYDDPTWARAEYRLVPDVE